MKTSKHHGVYGDSHMQHVPSIMCAYHVILHLERTKGRPMRDILLDFSKCKMKDGMNRGFAAEIAELQPGSLVVGCS